MALLANGIETAELGSTAWRVVYNNNFANLYTKTEITTNYYTKTEITTNHYTKTEITTNYYTKTESNTRNADMTFTANTHGVVLKDRTAGTYFRLFVDDGVLSIEAV